MTASILDYADVLRDLSKLSKTPILIGRMALIVYGSEQLTRDMDLVVPEFPEVIDILYRNGFRMISGKNVASDGSITYDVFDTALKARYAVGMRDKKSLRSIKPETRAELDVWLESPVPYNELLKGSKKVDLKGLNILVPTKENLIRLKEISLADDPSRAYKDRWDIDFLQGLIDAEKASGAKRKK